MATDDRSESGRKSAQKSAQKTAQKTAKKAPDGSSGEGRRTMGAVDVARGAAEQLAELTGKTPEAVTGLSRTDDGWRVELEVLEIHRVPETADVLAVYQVDVDPAASLQGYRRIRRYARGQVGEE